MNVPVKAQLKPIDTVRNALEKMKPQFMAALPKHITPDRMVRVAMTAIQNTPKLLECDQTSLISAVMRSAQLGLEPDGVLGQAYLIPYGNKVQFIIGYKGLIDLARRSGDVTSIFAKEVRENDHFEYQFGLIDVLEHKPAEGERGEITHFYAIAKFKSGGHHYDVMTVSEVNAIRDASQGYQSAKKFNKLADSPWVKNYDEMGKKTVIRRISKYLPMSVQRAAIVDDLVESGKNFTVDHMGDIVITQDETENSPIDAINAAINGTADYDKETGEIIEAQAEAKPEVKKPAQTVESLLSLASTIASEGGLRIFHKSHGEALKYYHEHDYAGYERIMEVVTSKQAELGGE